MELLPEELLLDELSVESSELDPKLDPELLDPELLDPEPLAESSSELSSDELSVVGVASAVGVGVGGRRGRVVVVDPDVVEPDADGRAPRRRSPGGARRRGHRADEHAVDAVVP